MAKKRKLGEMLIAAGFITEAQANECMGISVATDRRIGDILVEKGYITQDDLYRVLENQHNTPYIELASMHPNPVMSRYVPAELARRNTLVPVKTENNVLYVAIEDPKNFRALDEVRTAARQDGRPTHAGQRALH